MADGSDEPNDILKYYNKFLEGYESVFGTRFCQEAKVINYPFQKFILNRLVNLFIRIIFCVPYNDITNAFKCYSRKTIEKISPLSSWKFELTVEMPLKAIIRQCCWTVVPTNWYGRQKGLSKWQKREIFFGYLFLTISLWVEKMLSGAKFAHPKNKNFVIKPLKENSNITVY